MKTYINVQVNHLKNGNAVPVLIQWDDGREWKVQKVIHSCEWFDGEKRGIRYTVLIGCAEKYIYEANGRWYVLPTDNGGDN